MDLCKKKSELFFQSIISHDVISKLQIGLVCEEYLIEALRDPTSYLDRVILGIVGTVTHRKVCPSFLTQLVMSQSKYRQKCYSHTEYSGSWNGAQEAKNIDR